MIISDEFQFAFVHIPKAAGTSIRKSLSGFDSTHSKYTAREVVLEGGRTLDYVHLTLGELNELESVDFDKVNTYWSFAFTRDPYERFVSGLIQSVKKIGVDPRSVDNRFLTIYCEQVIDKLNSDLSSCYLENELVHLKKQCDFVYWNGEQMVDSVYDIHNLEGFRLDFKSRYGVSLSFNTENKSLTYKHTIFKVLFRYGRTYLPMVRNTRLCEIARELVLVDLPKSSIRILDEQYVIDFIDEFYALDFSMRKALAL